MEDQSTEFSKPKMKKIAYLRVSTAEQRPDRQIDGLKMMCDEIHIETLSAVSRRRPVYDQVLALLGPGDTLVVWDLDKAFRSVVDALVEGEKLRKRGVHFLIANLRIDTSTPGGIFVYTIMSALAEFERRTLSQRTKEGLAAARRRGAKIGRPSKLTQTQLQDAQRRLRADRKALGKIATECGVAPWTLTRALRRWQLTY
ncbi:recombinase family protein [Rhizobium lemnae]|uniref:Recombinase family protein n=1 Tax=Rhizobium lemnae TaxID=1214924 RepID=A0ABV8ED92_9HYPH|nr:recombinase family protein [Rhizobium lemnae]